MARADSTIRVNILGDAKSLQTAAATSEKAVGGLNKKLVAAGGLIAGVFVVDKLVDFGTTAVEEADRVADATGNIQAQLGPDLSRALLARADDFSKLGQSEGDMLELEKRIIDIGTASGATDPQLAGVAEQLSLAAAAMALTDTEGRDANYWIEQIGKAADGSRKPLLELGVNLDEDAVAQRALADTGKDSVEQLTAQELWAARVALIMEQLTPKIKDVSEGNADLEQKQAELNAKWETFTGEVGPLVADVLSNILDFVLKGVEGWELFAHWVDQNDKELREFAGPAARTADAINAIAEAFWAVIDAIMSIPELPGWFGDFIGNPGGSRPNRPPSTNRGAPGTVQVNVQGGSPEVIEQSVRRALQIATGHGPLE